MNAKAATASVLLMLASCGPLDHPLGADLDGRNYYAACSTKIPSGRLGDPVEGVVTWVPNWAETEERTIIDLAIEEGFAIHLPQNICGRKAKWVLLMNRRLDSERVEELAAEFASPSSEARN